MPVGIDVLAQQSNIGSSLCHCLAKFFLDEVGAAGALASPDIGNYTVGAEIIASPRNADQRPIAFLAAQGKSFCDQPILIGNTELTALEGHACQ